MENDYGSPRYEKWCFRLVRPFLYGLLFLVLLAQAACLRYVPVKKIDFFIRDKTTQHPAQGARLTISVPGKSDLSFPSDLFGHVSVNLKKAGVTPENISKVRVRWSLLVPRSSGSVLLADSMPLNPYIPLYDLYLDRSAVAPLDASLPVVSPVADMHYHISMRAHNYFGAWLYNDSSSILSLPGNIAWYRSYKKIRILETSGDGIKWKAVCKADTHQLTPAQMHTLLDHRWMYASGGSNKFTHYTEATFPHMAEGQVMLGFNAISPFEESTSRSWKNRLANQAFVTGAKFDWLKRIGKKEKPLTHWENFNLEYKMISRQSTGFNGFPWRFLRDGRDLDDPKPTLVLAVEGSHILQHRYFPNFVNFNIGQKDAGTIELLYARCRYLDTATLNTPRQINRMNKGFEHVGQVKEYLTQEEKAYINRTQGEIMDGSGPLHRKMLYVDSCLKAELRANITSLKALDPPVWMMTVSHLAYNGMTGHSVAWDQGSGFNNLVARRNYGIRVAEDKSYRRQWEGAFYTIPGVNQFGKLVLDSLLSSYKHRIWVDLKHSAPATRQYFIDTIIPQHMERVVWTERDTLVHASVMPTGKWDSMAIRGPDTLITFTFHRDTVFPICSHCGVNGFPRLYSSPFVNEYNITRAPFVHTFYPFAINLYDDEIREICGYNGIIGIPLEQRILGGYINKRMVRDFKVTRQGHLHEGRTQNIRRWTFIRRYLWFMLQSNDPDLMPAVDYAVQQMHVPVLEHKRSMRQQYKWVMKVLAKDYCSAEPFLYNVFHVVDHAHMTPDSAWQHVCIGSDLDGLIDPIDICPTASQYPVFKERLTHFIPVFLRLRQVMYPALHYADKSFYGFEDPARIREALNLLFYDNLFRFTRKNFRA